MKAEYDAQVENKFSFAHLPDGPESEIADLFYNVAKQLIAMMPQSSETLTGLQKLWEAKNAAVRGSLNYESIVDYFVYEHLPVELQEVSKSICEMARGIYTQIDMPPSESKKLLLLKLLEVKDLAVYSAAA